MLKGLFWEGAQRNGQFWLSMHFPLRQRSDHCPLSQKVDLAADRFAFFWHCQPKTGCLRGSRLRLHMSLPSASRREAPSPGGFPVAVLSVTLSFLKAEL